MDYDRVQLAAENNARWCDAVCRAHGLPCEFVADAWLTRGTPPPFYSNMVTMRGGASAAAQARLIREIIAADPLRAFGFKDSFCSVDLAAAGGARRFDILFEATWIWLDPARFTPQRSALRWARVRSDAELLDWERTWRGVTANSITADNAASPASACHNEISPTTRAPRQFPAALLAEPEIAFLSGTCENGQIEAVAVANRTGGVIGLSNVFGPAIAATELWPGATAAALDAFEARLPLVGYERAADLSHALALGFEPVGRLRVCVLAE